MEDNKMKRPNHLIAPIVIAGITVGFLVSAYKFVFAKPNSSKLSDDDKTEPDRNSTSGTTTHDHIEQ